MKKLFDLVALMALSLILPVGAETIKVFALNINALPNGGFSQTRKDGINDMLASKEIDVGYFFNMKATSYFNLSNDAYVFTPNSTTKFVFAHKAEKYDFVADLGAFDNHANCCVIKDKANQHYAIVFAHNSNSAQAFDVSSQSKCKAYNEQIRTAITTATNTYHDARVFVTYVEGFAVNEEPLKLYLTNGPYSISELYPPLGLSAVVDGGGKGGGIYTYLDASIANMSGSPVAIESETYNAIVGSVTYASTINVTFKDSLSDAESVVMVAQGGTAIPPEPWNHEDIGYDFDHWEGDYSQVLAECEVLAVYAKKTHDVRFVTIDDDGLTTNVVKQEVVEWGTAATAPADPERAGYMFMGWEPSDFSCVKSDMTIVAQFEELSNVFHVRFLDSDGVTILKEEDVAGGEAATAPADPTPHEVGKIFYGWNPSDFSRIEADTDIVAVFGPAVYEVSTVDEFAEVVANIPPPATVKLVNDLDFSEVKDYLSPMLVGTLDGNEHIISNLSEKALFSTVYGTVSNLTLSCFARQAPGGNSQAGLLADALRGATVSGVTVVDSVLTAKNSNCDLGLIASTVQTNSQGFASVVSNCSARNSTLTGIYGCVVGGIVSKLGRGCVVSDCQFICDDKSMSAIGNAVNNAGGIAGHVDGGTVVRCLVDAKITGGTGVESGFSAAGGIVGGVSGSACSILDCTNRADVAFASVDGGAGGIVGRVMKSTVVVERCVNFGAVSSSGEDDAVGSGCGVGGIVGGGWGNSPSVSIRIRDSKNSGMVSSTARHPAGGVIGYLHGVNNANSYLYITNCVNEGAVESLGHAGGIVGWALSPVPDKLSLINSGNAGAVHSATNCVGGIFGALDGQGQNNDKSFTYSNFKNIMNCGELTTDTGSVGSFAGRFQSTERNAYSAPLESAFFSEQGGEVGLVGVYEGKESVGVTVDESSQIAMAATDFTNHKAVKALNDYATANGLVSWVQTANCPELSIFAEGVIPEPKRGMMIFFW